jgi:predicted transcriptional regulator
MPKADCAYLYEDLTARQGLEKLRHSGYAAVPVIARSGKYVNTVSEGDFLWYLADRNLNGDFMEASEQIPLRDVLRDNRYPAVHITEPMEDLISRTVNQNFVPVVDDRESFIGIVTRREILKYFCGQSNRTDGTEPK